MEVPEPLLLDATFPDSLFGRLVSYSFLFGNSLPSKDSDGIRKDLWQSDRRQVRSRQER
jgi:hypothetical protein